MHFESIVVFMYRPPDTKLDRFEESLNMIEEAIDETIITDPKCESIIKVGGYNFPFWSWQSQKIYENQLTEGRKSEEEKQAELFLEYCNIYFLVQFCLTPTRGRNILDLKLSKNQDINSTYTTILNS